MKVFRFDHHLVENYERFSRSFSTIRARDLFEAIDAEYRQGRFWPDALLSLNPRYRPGPWIADLAADGTLDEATARVFRFGKTPLRLHVHQGQALSKARAGASFVVTTGTGSGKSLCFFIPIVDAILRARTAGQPRRTRAIIVYPMNALANSQIEEITKFIRQSDLPEDLRPRVRRYTGQESQEERREIADNPPDILLTNFMMAELLLTRQDEVDRQVIENARGWSSSSSTSCTPTVVARAPTSRSWCAACAPAARRSARPSASGPPPPWRARAARTAAPAPSPRSRPGSSAWRWGPMR